MLPGSKIAQTKDCQGHLQPESAGFGKRTESDYTQLQSGRRLKLRMTITEMKTTTETIWQDIKKVNLVEESHIGWSRYTPRNGVTEGSYIQLTQETWDRMPKSTPLSANMVEILTSTGRGTEFDIYAWLSQRIYALNHSHAYQTPLITWKSLQNQMGSNYADTRNFVTRFKQSLNHGRAATGCCWRTRRSIRSAPPCSGR